MKDTINSLTDRIEKTDYAIQKIKSSFPNETILKNQIAIMSAQVEILQRLSQPEQQEKEECDHMWNGIDPGRQWCFRCGVERAI